MTRPRCMYEKIWDAHVVVARDDGTALLFIDRHLFHEGSRNAFNFLRAKGRSVRRPDLTFGCADHLVPTIGQSAGVSQIQNPEARVMAEAQVSNTQKYGIQLFGLDDPRQGIVHVVGPEQGLTLPGLTMVCGDSHTSTHGALGALAFGIGASEVSHVLATQTLWQQRAKTMRITIDGALGAGVTSKDVILAIIGRIGMDGATGYVIEYAGSAVRAMSMEQRMTICNMAIEAGARAGMIAPDDRTYEYLHGRPYAPQGADWDRALAAWRALPSDPDAVFDRELAVDASAIAPMVTWGTSPEDAVAITDLVPDPAAERDPGRRARLEQALRYMDLRPGTPMTEIRVDRVFIGSCTNARIEDLRLAAKVVQGRKAVVPAMVVPGSRLVRDQAEAEGLDRIFRDAGLDWREPGCSMCLGMNGELVPEGERCASTSNRNFEGRQGKGSRTHLVSPSMAAAAAITGRFTDIRQLGLAPGQEPGVEIA
jgi:3-isopropylmalate/(R)-2-methylmalate dehydratase large subunit